jgi:hypothetical protein
MKRKLFGTAVVLLAAGQLIGATGASAHDKTVVVEPGQPQTQQPAPPNAVVVTQPQPIAAAPRPVGAEEVRAYGPNTTMIGSGILVFGVAYGTSAIVAGTSDHPGDKHLYVPVAGPWMDIADRGDCGASSGRSCDNETTNKVLLVADGVFQGLGVLSIIGGMFTPETREMTETAKKQAPKPSIHVAPARVGSQGYGLTAFGRF